MSMSLKDSSHTKEGSSSVRLGDSNASAEKFESAGNYAKSSESSDSHMDAKNEFKNNVETMIVKRLLQKAKQSFDTQNASQHQKGQTGSPIKKKHRRRYKSSKRKSKHFESMSKCDSEDENIKTSSTSLPLTDDSSHLEPLTIEVENLASPNQNILLGVETSSPLLKRHSMLLGRKKFTLPIVSARSSRRIFPQKRYLQEEELDVSSQRDSLLDTANSFGSDVPNINRKKIKHTKTSDVNEPLIEKKRSYKKTHLDVNNFCESTNFESDIGASTSRSDGIKLDMVSQYADKMAEKPKERRIKNGESRKNIFKSDDALAKKDKKHCDSLERIAAKIEKILRSQWEGRLNTANNTSPKKSDNAQQVVKAKTSPLSQWKSEQKQRACARKRTKNLIHKAKLRLKKRTLMKLRQPESIALLNEQLKNSQTTAHTEKHSLSPSGIDWPSTPMELKKSPIPPKFNVPGSKSCGVCGISANFFQVQKYYGRLACEACSKFFGNFIETPKQYFCSKDGNCKSNMKPMKNAKVSNIRFRCKACWMKSCMYNFTVSSSLRGQLLNYVPRLEAPPHGVLIEDCNALVKCSSTINFTPNVCTSKVNDSEHVQSAHLHQESSCIDAPASPVKTAVATSIETPIKNPIQEPLYEARVTLENSGPSASRFLFEDSDLRPPTSHVFDNESDEDIIIDHDLFEEDSIEELPSSEITIQKPFPTAYLSQDVLSFGPTNNQIVSPEILIAQSSINSPITELSPTRILSHSDLQSLPKGIPFPMNKSSFEEQLIENIEDNQKMIVENIDYDSDHADTMSYKAFETTSQQLVDEREPEDTYRFFIPHSTLNNFGCVLNIKAVGKTNEEPFINDENNSSLNYYLPAMAEEVNSQAQKYEASTIIRQENNLTFNAVENDLQLLSSLNESPEIEPVFEKSSAEEVPEVIKKGKFDTDILLSKRKLLIEKLKLTPSEEDVAKRRIAKIRKEALSFAKPKVSPTQCKTKSDSSSTVKEKPQLSGVKETHSSVSFVKTKVSTQSKAKSDSSSTMKKKPQLSGVKETHSSVSVAKTKVSSAQCKAKSDSSSTVKEKPQLSGMKETHSSVLFAKTKVSTQSKAKSDSSSTMKKKPQLSGVKETHSSVSFAKAKASSTQCKIKSDSSNTANEKSHLSGVKETCSSVSNKNPISVTSNGNSSSSTLKRNSSSAAEKSSLTAHVGENVKESHESVPNTDTAEHKEKHDSINNESVASPEELPINCDGSKSDEVEKGKYSIQCDSSVIKTSKEIKSQDEILSSGKITLPLKDVSLETYSSNEGSMLIAENEVPILLKNPEEIASSLRKSKDVKEKDTTCKIKPKEYISSNIKGTHVLSQKEPSSSTKTTTLKSSSVKNKSSPKHKQCDLSSSFTESKASSLKTDEVRPVIPKSVVKPRGPRVKHVCRRADVALGLPKATFGKKVQHFNLSALPQEEKQKILAANADA